jgi:hypothetical protein
VTKYDNALMRIISAYTGMPPSPTLLEQLGGYIDTQVERAVDKAKNEIAATVCEELHDGPPKMGVMCRSCYEAEKNAPGIIEIESRRQIKEMREFGKARDEEAERASD